MNISTIYKENFRNITKFISDFNLVKYNDYLFIGKDKEDHATAVVISSTPNSTPHRQKTKAVSIECNSKVTYLLNNNLETNTVHILRCLEKNNTTIDLFLELVEIMAIDRQLSATEFLSIYHKIAEFFISEKSLSDNELVGLYGEIFTINYFNKYININKYWQTKANNKFDFSFSQQDKLEIKTTVKPERIHHFNNEQINQTNLNIFVLSYKLQYDDQGISLINLINQLKTQTLCEQHLFRINKILKNVPEDRLENFKYNKDYTINNMKLFKADLLPKIINNYKDKITHIEYNLNLGWEAEYDKSEYIKYLKNILI